MKEIPLTQGQVALEGCLIWNLREKSGSNGC